jgi:hypothetical protein
LGRDNLRRDEMKKWKEKTLKFMGDYGFTRRRTGTRKPAGCGTSKDRRRSNEGKGD